MKRSVQTQRPCRKSLRGRSSETATAAQSLDIPSERERLLEVLRENRGNLTKAAEAIGFCRESFLLALKQHGISDVM